MGNRYGWRAVIVLVLLALGCRVGLAQIGPRYVIELEGAAQAAPTAPGRVQLAGKGLALIRFQGLTILTVGADADAYSAEAARRWPAADLLLVTPASSGRYGGVAPLASLGKLPVIVVEPVAAGLASAKSVLRPPQFYPMQTWDALHLRKGKTRLRVTALPGPPGSVNVAGFMLEVGNSWASYRLYVSCEPVGADAAGVLAQRLPGADLALLPDRNAPLLLALQRAAPPAAGAAARPAALTEAGHAFKAIKR
ncbi:hypothetical protein [Duganella vulcania]|uniref:MBL fold metallo-hydrolase n=1 Tax=Duganella vulcania TaxID=2692166 RepID=A0A845GLZ5_9BURK|nr:hypothetical protein [Duganella vulcania]MYM94376.1 hypothetical protein [Duganella vulcania]